MRNSGCEQAEVHSFGLFSLLRNILLHDIPIAALPDGRSIVSIRPELSSPELLAKLGVTSE